MRKLSLLKVKFVASVLAIIIGVMAVVICFYAMFIYVIANVLKSVGLW